MGTSSSFIIKTLLLLWIACIVMCEHQKRDVRVVLKQRVPRSHKKGHRHTRGHDHKRGNYHSSRSKGRGHGKGKKHLASYEDSSEENDSYSRESSFEDMFQKHKNHKSQIYHDSKKSHRSPSSYHINQDYEESKLMPYKEDSRYIFPNEWIPLSSEQVHHNSRESHRDRHKRKKDARKKIMTSLRPPPIDITTSYPFQFETSSVYPQLIDYPSAFSNYNLNQKIMESNQSPLIGTIEQPNIQFSEVDSNFNRLKNHRASYEVTELAPAASNTNTFISVPDISEESVEEVTTKISKPVKEENKTTVRPTRNRGRLTHRGQKRA